MMLSICRHTTKKEGSGSALFRWLIKRPHLSCSDRNTPLISFGNNLQPTTGDILCASSLTVENRCQPIHLSNSSSSHVILSCACPDRLSQGGMRQVKWEENERSFQSIECYYEKSYRISWIFMSWSIKHWGIEDERWMCFFNERDKAMQLNECHLTAFLELSWCAFNSNLVDVQFMAWIQTHSLTLERVWVSDWVNIFSQGSQCIMIGERDDLRRIKESRLLFKAMAVCEASMIIMIIEHLRGKLQLLFSTVGREGKIYKFWRIPAWKQGEITMNQRMTFEMWVLLFGMNVNQFSVLDTAQSFVTFAHTNPKYHILVT